MKTFVIADIHGNFKGFKECLKKSHFDYENDRLICLGDTADGYPDVAECFDELLKIKDLVYIYGNHDIWLHEWMKFGIRPDIWTSQGGRASIDSYVKNPDNMVKIDSHKKILDNAYYWCVDDDRLFVHGGFKPGVDIRETNGYFITWDRDLWNNRESKIDIAPYKEVYVGHTSIYNTSKKPVQFNNVWFMDSGSGYEGVTTIMDIDTKEIWQSEKASILYKDHKGRNSAIY